MQRAFFLLLAGGFLLLVPSRAVAELVLLTTGEVIKVAEFRTDGGAAELVLPQGGSLSLSILRIDRVLEDEIETPAPEAEGSGPGADGALPVRLSFALDYAPQQEIPEVPYGALIYWAARKHQLNPALIAAVAWAESAFDAGVISVKGAVGLLQLMPSTGRRFGLERWELFDPKKNVEAGSRYLRWLVDRFEGDLPLALAAYNAGEGAVDRFGGIPPYRETQGYVRRILASLEAGELVASTVAPAGSSSAR